MSPTAFRIPFSPRHTFVRWVLCAVLAVFVAKDASAQANFHQGFDSTTPTTIPNIGPDDLSASGWEFRKQTHWGSSVQNFRYAQFAPFELPAESVAGSDYLYADCSFGGNSALWMILPTVAGQTAGDTLGMWINGLWSGNGALFELRYSPSGGIDTGSGPFDLGDFDVLLTSVDGVDAGWDLVTAAVPGAGRLAVRIYEFTSYSMRLGIDELTVGPPPSGCSNCVPMPAPGETVHWTTSHSPVVFSESETIVAGGTVIVDPGVQVIVDNSAHLYVEGILEFSADSSYEAIQPVGVHTSRIAVYASGELRFLGSAAQPVTITGGQYTVPSIDLYGAARLRIDHAIVQGAIRGDWTLAFDGAPTIHATNSTFLGTGPYQWIDQRAGTLVLEDCVFDGAWIATEEVHHTLRNLTLTNGATLRTYRRWIGQPMLLDTITANGTVDDAPFRLAGNDHHFGPNNVISGNRWPVRLLGGGLTRTSVLPTGGNFENAIAMGINHPGTDLPTSGQRTGLPHLGLPYHVLTSSGFVHGVVDPGALFRLAPGAGILPAAGGTGTYELLLRGTAEAPIRLEPLYPGQRWNRILYAADGDRATMDWVEIDGATMGVYCDEGAQVTLQNTTLSNCERGGYSTNSGKPRFRSVRFLNNVFGVDTSSGLPPSYAQAGNFDADGLTNPNSFVGNVTGARDRSDYVFSKAGGNWWNDPSGPTNPNNPSGTGDSVEQFALFTPFLTQPPNPTNCAPSVGFVQLNRADGGVYRPGERIILRWEATDDGPIDHFRLEYTPLQGCSGFDYATLIDNIPGHVRGLVVEVPDKPVSSCVRSAAYKIVAVDATGTEGIDVWDHGMELPITEPGPPMPALPSVIRPGAVYPNFNSGHAIRVHDGSELSFAYQGNSSWLKIPAISTDLARVTISWSSSPGTTTSEMLEIRPDPAVTGDFPPQIQMTSPLNGQSFTFGGIVPIAWTATDDDPLRSFEVQVSYGRDQNWHSVIKDLAPTVQSYDFVLPESVVGISGVRFRVLARDRSFQVTSDGGQNVVTLLPQPTVSKARRAAGVSPPSGTVPPPPH